MGSEIIRPEYFEFSGKRTRYLFAVIAWNEGDRIRTQLRQMSARADLADILVVDGDSQDGPMEQEWLRVCKVRGLLVIQEPGLGTAIRGAIQFAIDERLACMVRAGETNTTKHLRIITPFYRGKISSRTALDVG